jgi:hypothetical protein
MPVALMDHDTASHGLSDLRGYISYSHEDLDMVRRLSSHLIPAARTELGIEFWTDASIKAGRLWSEEISDAIARANIFILCMSADYLASEFLYHVELPAIRQRSLSSDALIVPLIMRQCAWWGFVGDFQAVPTHNGRVLPIANWRPRENGYRQAAVEIMQAVRHHFLVSAGQPVSAGLKIKSGKPRAIQPAPPGPHRVSPLDIDRAVETVIARRTAENGA